VYTFLTLSSRTAGVTRDSIIQLARRLGYDVVEEPVRVHEAVEADEVFTTGELSVRCEASRMTVRC